VILNKAHYIQTATVKILWIMQDDGDDNAEEVSFYRKDTVNRRGQRDFSLMHMGSKLQHGT
jgi:hypothetical protein